MSVEASVKDDPECDIDQACIKQESELNEAEWVNNDAEWMNNEPEYVPQLCVKQEPVQIEQEVIHIEQEEIPIEQEVIHIGQEVIPIEQEVIHIEQEVIPIEQEVIHFEQEVIPIEQEVIHIEQEEIPNEQEVIHIEQEVIPIEPEVIHIEQEEIPIKQEEIHLKEKPICVLQKVVCLRQESGGEKKTVLVKDEPAVPVRVKEEPAWMGGAPPHTDFKHAPMVPRLPPPLVPDEIPNNLVRDCYVRLERCVVPCGAMKRLEPATASLPSGALQDTTASPNVSQDHEREKALKQLSELLIKRPVYKNTKTYFCDLCNKDFVIKSNLSRHRRTHITKKREMKPTVALDEIPQLFSVYDRRSLPPRKSVPPAGRVTSRSRFDPAPTKHSSKCEVCQAVLNDFDSLKEHALIHAKVPRISLTCKVCYKEFSSRAAFKTHELFHAESRPYPCVVCKKRFTRQFDLHKHIIYTHKGDRNECKLCEKQQALRLLGGLISTVNNVDIEQIAVEDTDHCKTCNKVKRSSVH